MTSPFFHWLVTTRITPSFPFSKTILINIHSKSNPKRWSSKSVVWAKDCNLCMQIQQINRGQRCWETIPLKNRIELTLIVYCLLLFWLLRVEYVLSLFLCCLLLLTWTLISISIRCPMIPSPLILAIRVSSTSAKGRQAQSHTIVSAFVGNHYQSKLAPPLIYITQEKSGAARQHGSYASPGDSAFFYTIQHTIQYFKVLGQYNTIPIQKLTV